MSSFLNPAAQRTAGSPVVGDARLRGQPRAGEHEDIADGDQVGQRVERGTGRARHYFCPVCGVAVLRNPRGDPSKFSVNARCIDGVDLSALEREHIDGRNWALE